eukprot:scaffold86310_cov31-Tisochrysis_lutea.AAC.3
MSELREAVEVDKEDTKRRVQMSSGGKLCIAFGHALWAKEGPSRQVARVVRQGLGRWCWAAATS